MRQELDEALCADFPLIFRDRHADMRTTAMCWGFEHGDGWYNILRALCSSIQGHIDWKNKTGVVVKQVVAMQVKEKFGSLRFYYNGGDDYIRGLVSMAEAMSVSTCEECGVPGKIYTDGWFRALCEGCAEKAGRE